MTDEVKKEALARLRANWKASNTPAKDRDEDRYWLSNLRHISTEEAFKIAESGGTIVQLFEDGTDSLLDDLKTENEYYPDKSKSYPEIPTIFFEEK